MFHLAECPPVRQIGIVKRLTRDQVEARKEKAVRFVQDVLDDPERASEIEDESVEDYAERRKFEIVNPTRRVNTVASKAELEQRIEELESENEELQSRLDEVLDIVAPPEDEVEEEDGEDDDLGEE